mmetsp:Transcript_29298/g.62279  ORF Transcript_29298/g.62279 Transcript_29298/m.62279 type:complete len:213 (-) Transcript_29298:96-734(-)|eukprot:CAMPEP_0172320984 /NCGR_PEP_ID=MMETSP1058-20130122/41935_1 /TAXON_ID=83371 /ORGANISM="Detonula confervacea, Strain CCMP 353" /LENGTH=212 /DNA_ID=CAMNT_0013036357 /DNA_START=58 /DNA_END=696 /DNA_ORIENTATION=+
MTTRPSSWLLLSTLALLCIIAAILRNNKQSTSTVRRRQTSIATTRQTKQSQTTHSYKMKNRKMVGGYSDMDIELLQSRDVREIAAFALSEHVAGSSTFDSASLSLAVSPEEVRSGVVQMKVLEAQRQVVAGLNYKLTLAIIKDNVCLGGFKITVYKPLPHMEQGLTVTSWGKTLECSEIKDLMQAVIEKEEENALLVEGEIEEEHEEVEPNA